MLKATFADTDSSEKHFFHLYKMVRERECYLTDEAMIVQYGAVLRYFMKFLEQQDSYSEQIMSVLYHIFSKLGDIYYKDALQNQDNSRYFLAAEYYNQALSFARQKEEKSYILVELKDIYYYLGDDAALVKVEETWAENHDKKDKFAASMLLAQNSDKPQIKVCFLTKALETVMAQDESFYIKYQNTLDVCSQLSVLYELLGERKNAKQVKTLRENTIKLLN